MVNWYYDSGKRSSGKDKAGSLSLFLTEEKGKKMSPSLYSSLTAKMQAKKLRDY